MKNRRKGSGFFVLLLFLIFGVVVFFAFTSFGKDACINKKSESLISVEKNNKENKFGDLVSFDFIFASCSMALKNRGNSLKNSERAAELIDGVILQPGESFSAFKYFGNGGKRQGFFYAKVVGGMGYGGGLCRTLTLLHILSFLADFDIVERKPHSAVVEYGVLGLDSAFNFCAKDASLNKNLEFYNNRKYPIKIITNIQATEDQDHVLTISFACNRKLTKKCNVKITSKVLSNEKVKGKRVINVLVNKVTSYSDKSKKEEKLSSSYFAIEKGVKIDNLTKELEKEIYF